MHFQIANKPIILDEKAAIRLRSQRPLLFGGAIASCKKMPVIPVINLVDKIRVIWKGGCGGGEELGLLTTTPPKKRKSHFFAQRFVKFAESFVTLTPWSDLVLCSSSGAPQKQTGNLRAGSVTKWTHSLRRNDLTKLSASTKKLFRLFFRNRSRA
jgi:hypothetical protein